MIKFFAVIFLASLSAHAHLDLVTYTGKTAQGEVCQMTVEQVYFENNLKHPLNERAVVKVNGSGFTVQHPVVISVSDILASFDHDQLQGVLPNTEGAQGFAIKMDHSNGNDGPTEFHLIDHNYKLNKRSIYSCFSLKQ